MRLLLQLGSWCLDVSLGKADEDTGTWDSGYTASTPIGFTPNTPAPCEADFPDRI